MAGLDLSPAVTVHSAQVEPHYQDSQYGRCRGFFSGDWLRGTVLLLGDNVQLSRDWAAGKESIVSYSVNIAVTSKKLARYNSPVQWFGVKIC